MAPNVVSGLDAHSNGLSVRCALTLKREPMTNLWCRLLHCCPQDRLGCWYLLLRTALSRPVQIFLPAAVSQLSALSFNYQNKQVLGHYSMVPAGIRIPALLLVPWFLNRPRSLLLCDPEHLTAYSSLMQPKSST